MQSWQSLTNIPPQDAALEMAEDTAIPDQKTLMLVNTFTLQTVQLLNRFAITCEQKLAEVSRKRQGVEIRIALLEAQLRSVDRPSAALPDSTLSSHENLGILPQEAGGDSLAGASVASETPEGLIEPHREREVSQGQQQQQKKEEGKVEEEEEEEAAPSPSPQAPQIQDHPAYSRFFRMVRVGVPHQGVKRQMALEGLDPSLLDDPDGPAPVG